MPVVQSVVDQVRKLLPAGAAIRYLFPAMYLPTGARVGVQVIVVVTDQAIQVIKCGSFSLRLRAKSVVGTYSRAMKLGPVGDVTPTITINGYHYEIDDEYIAVVNAADAELAGDDALPVDPHPDL